MPDYNSNNNNNSTTSTFSSGDEGSSITTTTVTTATNHSPGEEFTIRVLTLNCWGLWLGAKKRRQRMAGIVRYLKENNCDIVFLQEVWVTSDFEIIRDGTNDIYRFAHLFRSGSVLGSSGIVVLSKWLPKVIHFEPYSLNGSPFYPWHGDWFAGKGIAYSRVDFDGLSLHLFSTHTHAYYKENESVFDQYSVHRVCQSYQLARLITFISDTACNRRASGKDLFIVAGDMNSTSSELPYKILTTLAGLTDCFKTSRYSNTSNIIHKHKIMNNKQRYSNDSNSGHLNSNQECSRGRGFCRLKHGENFLLDTLDAYRSKIAQVLFDSDTDDEDITYGHPRNSFTPGTFDQQTKVSKSIAYNNIPSTIATIEESQESSSLNKNKPNGDNSNTNNKIDKNDNNNTQSNNLMKQQNENSVGGGGQRKLKKKTSTSKRIDFILCRLLTHGHCIVDRVATESKDPTLECSLSDHEPVMVELRISDVSHDLMEKNHIVKGDMTNSLSKQQNLDHSRPLVEVVESKVSVIDASQIEETTNQWVPEQVPVNLDCHDCNIQVMRSTQKILTQYYKYNRTSKTKLFYISLFMFIITMPSATYYALANELIPISTIVFMWLAASFLFAIIVLIGFLSYRFEQGAIEAILNDITCKLSVAKNNV